MIIRISQMPRISAGIALGLIALFCRTANAGAVDEVLQRNGAAHPRTAEERVDREDEPSFFDEIERESRRIQREVEESQRRYQRAFERMLREPADPEDGKRGEPSRKRPKSPRFPMPDFRRFPWEPPADFFEGAPWKAVRPGTSSWSWSNRSSSSFRRSNDAFSASQMIRGLEVRIEGKAGGRELEITKIEIDDGRKRQFSRLEDVPEQYRDEAAEALKAAQKQFAGK